MQIKRKQISTSRRFLWAVLGVLLLVAVISAVDYFKTGSLFGWNPFSTKVQPTSGNNPPSPQQINNGSGIKATALDSGKTSGSDQPAAPVAQADGRLLVQVDITSVNKINSITRVGVLISTLDQSGTCTITVTTKAGDTVYTASAGVQALPNSSTCKGFDIPNSNLPASGYTITISYVSDKKYGVAHYVQA